jgi:tryptophan halogenase
MWQIPLMDRKGCGYVFCDAFTTPDKAQEEIETILGQEIEPVKVIKFDTGRQETLWVNNCLTIGLSAAFLEPLEATSIHSSVVLAKNFTFEYLKSTLEDTLNSGSMKIYNNRAVKMFDDVRDFLVMHYMGGRTDSDFWKFINTGVTKTEYVSDLMDMAKTRIPTMNDFPQYYGSAGWPLYSFVMAGLGMFDKSKAINDLNINVPGYGHLDFLTRQIYHDNQDSWAMERRQLHTYEEFIKYFRDIRTTNGF